jgi:hypothetical protein
MTRNGFPRLDYSMLSSYLGRWATLIVFSAIVLIAAGALFLKEDDIAHMPVQIGIFDLDSAEVHARFADLADYIREKGGGDIRWAYIGEEEEPAGCDFYVMTSLRFAPYLHRGDLDCSLLMTVREGRRYSKGCVITKPGGPDLERCGMTAVFTSRYSAASFLAPYDALAAEYGEFRDGQGSIYFAGSEKRVIYGVIYGTYAFGGMSLERMSVLEEMAVFRDGELEIALEGDSYPELILAVDRSMDARKHRRFRERFALLTDRMPADLRSELISLGISGFVPPRDEDIEIIRRLRESIPRLTARAAETTGEL